MQGQTFESPAHLLSLLLMKLPGCLAIQNSKLTFEAKDSKGVELAWCKYCLVLDDLVWLDKFALLPSGDCRF